jgi:Transposase IS116/IS110/IS902 family
MAYVGLVPSEHSSGGSRRRGHLTKTGNRLLRHVLGETAHHARLQPAVSEGLRQRQCGVPNRGARDQPALPAATPPQVPPPRRSDRTTADDQCRGTRARGVRLGHRASRAVSGGAGRVTIGAKAASVVGVDIEGREPSTALCGDQPAPLVRGSSATNHCHAAPALPTREYQSDDRRCSLTSPALPAFAPLDKNFHIRAEASVSDCDYSQSRLTASLQPEDGRKLDLSFRAPEQNMPSNL